MALNVDIDISAKIEIELPEWLGNYRTSQTTEFK